MLSLFIASCGNSGKGGSDNPNEIKLKVEQDLGELGEYLTLDDEVLIKLEEAEEDGVQGYIITSSMGVNVKKAVASNYSFGLEAEILDENHIRIESFPDYEIDSKLDYDNGDYNNVLYSGQKWATVKTGVVKKEDWDKEGQKVWDKFKKDGAYIRIMPDYSSAKFVAYKGSNNSSSGEMSSEENDEDEISEVSASDSEDWDELLESYEEYVDKYISYLKKASKGDMTALSEYPALMQKAQNFSDRMKNAESSMSASQWARYNKITMKMLEAAQNMHE